MKSSSGISAKQEKLIAYLLSERTIDSACGKAKVAVTTYWRWMQTPAFLSEYRKARVSILENTVTRLQSLTFEAIDTLERSLHCENPSVESRTAAVILDQALKGLEMLDLAQRVDTLEQLQKECEENGKH
jgi:hypothetical protein